MMILHLVRVAPSLWIYIGLSLLFLFLWILADLKHAVRSHRLRNELKHEGRNEEVEALIQSQLRSFRPWERLFRRIFFPGGWETLYALHLYEWGRSEEALSWAEAAVHRSAGHARTAEPAQNARGLALLQLGSLVDARAVAGLLRSIRADSPDADFLEGFIDFYQGRLDEALSHLRRIPPGPKFEVARGLMSSILRLKGDVKEALELLVDRPIDVSVFYSPEGLRRVQDTEEGRSLLEAQQKTWAGVIQPSRFIYAAYIYLDQEDPEGLRFSLQKAASLMGGSPVLRRIHQELEACLSALTGDADGVYRHLNEGRAILERHPKRVSSMEFHRNAGRANLLLGRPALAIPELEVSLQEALHPIEKHVTRYWLARSAEAAGELPRAKDLYREGVADGIPSRLAADAAARLKG